MAGDSIVSAQCRQIALAEDSIGRRQYWQSIVQFRGQQRRQKVLAETSVGTGQHRQRQRPELTTGSVG